MPYSKAGRARMLLRRKLDGKCLVCGAGLQEDDGATCVECTEAHRRWLKSPNGRASKVRSTIKTRKAYASAGRCIDCGGAVEPGRKRCLTHLQANAARTATYRARRAA